MPENTLTRRVDVVHEFGLLQESPDAPRLAQFVAIRGRISDSDLAELVMIDQSGRWAKGERPLVEEYLDSFPQLLAHDEELVGLLAYEFELRELYGEAAEPGQYLDRIPAVRSRLQEHFRMCQLLSTTECSAEVNEACERAPRLPPKYCLLDVHGEGGLGRVWRAHDRELHREVVVKELRAEFASRPDVRERFLREARVTGQLEHPNIVPVYELIQGAEHDQPFYVMRFVRGQTLSEAIRNLRCRQANGKADPVAQLRLLNAFISTCNAVAYAHSRGVVHRDLKPENIVLGRFGEVFVADWGLAKVAGSADWGSSTLAVEEPPTLKNTVPGSVMGTPAYMAPEQATGRPESIDARTDIYGLGAILYVILTGRPPHEGTSRSEVVDRICKNQLTPPRSLNRSVPAALEAICLKAMAKAPEQRYTSATELAQEVHRWMADEPLAASREPIWSRTRRWFSRHRVIAVIGGVVALAFAVTSSMARSHLNSLERLRAVQARDASLSRFGQFQKLAADAYFYGLGGPVGDVGEAQRACDKALALYGVQAVEHVHAVRDSNLDPALAAQLRQELAQLFILRVCLKLPAPDPTARRSTVEAVLQRFDQVGLRSRVLTDYFRAEEHRARDELEDATRYYQRVLAAEPQNYWALTGLGQCYLRTAQPRLAWLAYQTCIGLHPRSPWPWTQRGAAAALSEETDLALEDFEHALEIDPDFVPARFNLGLLHAMRGNHRAAIEHFTMCLNHARKASILNARAKSWLALGQLANALDDVESALQLHPEFTPALVTRANIKSHGAEDNPERLQAAVQDLDQAMDRAPTLMEAHLERAKVMELLGNITEAVNAYGRALEIVRFDAAILRERARLLVASSRKREAVKDYSLLIRAGKASHEDLRRSGDCHADLELWREAISDYSEALRQQPDDPATLFRRAHCYTAQGELTAALSDCARVLQLLPADPAAQDLAARIQGMQSSR